MRILEYTDINAQQHISYWHFLVCFNASYIFEARGLKLTTPSYLLTMLENGNPICFLSSLYTDMSILGIDGCNSMFLR